MTRLFEQITPGQIDSGGTVEQPGQRCPVPQQMPKQQAILEIPSNKPTPGLQTLPDPLQSTELVLEVCGRVRPAFEGSKLVQTVRLIQDPVEVKRVGPCRQIQTRTQHVKCNYQAQP
ncbi:hypothetical protein D9M71_532100 [compost metagenome]